jgi:hypothetical protein
MFWTCLQLGSLSNKFSYSCRISKQKIFQPAFGLPIDDSITLSLPYEAGNRWSRTFS